MHMKTYLAAAFLGLSASAFAGGQHQQHLTTVYADTADEIYAAYVSGKPTLIKVAPGTYTFTTSFVSETYGFSTLPPLSNTIVIEGADPANTTFNGGRNFIVIPGGRLTLKNVTLTNGLARCNQDVCDQFGGGAAANYGGVLNIQNCVLMGNVASSEDGGGTAGGGAILNASGYLRLEKSTVTGNAAFRGGAISIGGGSAIIRHSIISGNRTLTGIGNYFLAPGGGIYMRDAQLRIYDSTISGNTAAEEGNNWAGDGAGLYAVSGRIWIVNSAITENASLQFGLGGGIYNGAKMHIIDSTVGGNTARQAGGGIHNTGTLELQGVTIAGNEALGEVPTYVGQCIYTCDTGGGGIWSDPSGLVKIRQSVVATNTGHPGGPDCFGKLFSLGHNAIGDTTDCMIDSTANLLNLNVRLGAFDDNGDPGDAHYPPLANSPLIDAGGKEGTDGDQFGDPRQDGNGNGRVSCDIGAVELQPAHP